MKIDMNNHLDSTLLTAFTLYLYVANQHIVPAIIDIPIWPIFLKIINDNVIGVAVLLSALSTGALNGYKFYQLWKDEKRKQSDKDKTINQ